MCLLSVSLCLLLRPGRHARQKPRAVKNPSRNGAAHREKKDGLALIADTVPVFVGPRGFRPSRAEVAKGEETSFRPVAEMQLPQNCAHKIFDRGVPHRKPLCDGLVGQSLSKQRENLAFAWRQIGQDVHAEMPGPQDGQQRFRKQAITLRREIDDLVQPFGLAVDKKETVAQFHIIERIHDLGFAQDKNDLGALANLLDPFTHRSAERPELAQPEKDEGFAVAVRRQKVKQRVAKHEEGPAASLAPLFLNNLNYIGVILGDDNVSSQRHLNIARALPNNRVCH
ncbi:MAG: hypothetical protein RBS99_17715 [Rhodospirillales bacterium]|nr:hypothetical protein [Rhodospirillales bacterium]